MKKEISYSGTTIIISEEPLAALQLALAQGKGVSSKSRRNEIAHDCISIVEKHFPKHEERFLREFRLNSVDFNFEVKVEYMRAKYPYNAAGIIIVTKHPALAEYLLEIGFLKKEDNYTIKEKVNELDVKGMWVVGFLPHDFLKEKVALYTHIPMEFSEGLTVEVEHIRHWVRPMVHYLPMKRINL